MQKTLDEKGVTYEDWLLYEGLRLKKLEYVSIAIDKGANVNTARDWLSNQPPLFMAVSIHRQDPQIVRLLLQKGATMETRWTPELNLDRPDISPIQRFMAQAAAKEQNRDYFPLYHAALHSRSADVVKVLLESGADVNAKTGNLGMTALFATYEIDIARLLLQHGADINARNVRGETVLKHAKGFYALNDPNHWMRRQVDEYCNWLIANGAKE
jgi:ankyrin repeat protein